MPPRRKSSPSLSQAIRISEAFLRGHRVSASAEPDLDGEGKLMIAFPDENEEDEKEIERFETSLLPKLLKILPGWEWKDQDLSTGLGSTEFYLTLVGED